MRAAAIGSALLLWGVPLMYPALRTSWSAHDIARLIQVLVLTCVAIWLAWQARRYGHLTPSASFSSPPSAGLRVAQSALALCVTFSAAQATHPLIAVRELTVFMGLWLFARWVTDAFRSQEAIATVLRLLCVGALVHGVICLLLVALSVVFGNASEPTAALIGFDNPRFLNHVQTIALPLVAAVSAGDGKKSWRLVGWWALFVAGMLLFMTSGRATLLALTVGLLTALWAFGPSAWHYFRRTVIPSIAGIATMWVCYLIWMRDAGYVIDVEQFGQAHYRDFLLHQAWKLWLAQPWFGVGPMHFAHWYTSVAAHPHNIYAQLLAEYGLPAALLTLLLVGRWLFQTLCRLRRPPSEAISLAIALWGVWVGVAVDGAFSGNFVMPMSQLWIAFALGLTGAVLSRFHGQTGPEPATPSLNSAMRNGARFAGLCVCAMALLWLSAQSLYEGLDADEPMFDTPGPVNGALGNAARSNPRFWNIGVF